MNTKKRSKNVYRVSLLTGEDRDRYIFLMKQICYLEEKIEFLERVQLLAKKSGDESRLDCWQLFSINSEIAATHRDRKKHLIEKGEIRVQNVANIQKAARISQWKGVQPINATIDWTNL